MFMRLYSTTETREGTTESRMFILQSSQPTYCGNAFASSSCQTEYDGNVESSFTRQKFSLGGLKSMRRNSSNLSQLSTQDVCAADATQIEIDFTSLTVETFCVSVEAPTGEIGVLTFSQYGSTQVFKPSQSGCGHGQWTFRVYQVNEESQSVLGMETMTLDGVGSLFFSVEDDFVPRLSAQEFLSMSGLCTKNRC